MFSPALSFFVTSQRYDPTSNRFQHSRGRPTDAQLAADFIQVLYTAPWPHLMQIGVPDLASCHHYGLFFDKKRALL